MIRKMSYLIVYTVLTFSVCEKQDSMEILLHKTEKLEADILKSVDSITKYRANYEKILKEAPASELAPIACYKLGKLNEIFGHYDEAIEYYQKLLKFYPEHSGCAEGLFNIAQIQYLYLKNNDEALETYQRVVDLFPQSTAIFQSLLQLGQISCEEQYWSDAVDYFSQIINQYPEHALCDDLCFRVADISQFHLFDDRQAGQWYKHLLDQYPHSPWIQQAQTRLSELALGGDSHEK